MAALVTSVLLPQKPSPWSIVGLFKISTFQKRVTPLGFSTVLGAGLLQNLLDLFPPFLLAVPKKKVSHSRKAMRSANKGLKDKHNIVNCPACGSAKLAHHICQRCLGELNRAWKTQQKAGQGIFAGAH
ncbi:hypothetical protein DACRYDRAFT_52312 [Dacryopinax primogenitus]|uniref:Large ribosomal subunit protein bL32m n=1 Tax=Dacryopinax primogenitus (strain DJM 731) TaxID=1858805 RepID=M5G143_DACPD|nr:uncharacterized protein DACRYDRAFT_52312 [Dacryopinax primogenitus]EJU01885.1 hypothetical protein DACRYDRAFT_52312 [Dacryopinax primogenitus]